MITKETFTRIANRYGTPAYVYEEKIFRDRIRRLIASIAYPNTSILYAAKANTNPVIAGIAREEGLGVDVVSCEEIALMLTPKVGFQPRQILYTASNITDEEMIFAAKKGVLLNIDSLSRLSKFGNSYPGERVCVRINPNVGAGHHDHCITGGPESKFGIWYSETDEIKRIAKRFNLCIIGIHQHIGSGILDVEKFLLAMDVLLAVAPEFSNLEFIDFGGGLGVPYKPEDKSLDVERLGREMSNRFRKFCDTYGKKLLLVIEPGRWFVAECGHLLGRVNTIKRNPDGRIFVGLDTGMGHLIRPAMYGSYHPIVNISNPYGEAKENYDIGGPYCESGDIFARERKIPLIKEGDLLSIEIAGAYGYSMSSNYNLRRRPIEVLVTPNNEILIIRKRETTASLIEGGM